ncbi:MAG: response regulator transcription factor [Spirochaetes bacterium]|nr:response regulator transcription factor [Spirochaetota bacterium]
MARVYLIEDNEAIREAVKGYLELNEHEVVQFGKITNVLEAMDLKNPDIIIIDVMLPDGSGFNLAKQIRKKSNVPFIFLTARDQESDRITGFEIGADDYVVKPFSPRELVLRIEAVLKRTSAAGSSSNGVSKWVLDNDILEIDKNSHAIKENGKQIDFTAGEWKIVNFLSENSGIVLSREKLLGESLDYFYEGSERIIDTHIKNIRSKLENQNWVKTVRGFGYKFEGKQEKI